MNIEIQKCVRSLIRKTLAFFTLYISMICGVYFYWQGCQSVTMEGNFKGVKGWFSSVNGPLLKLKLCFFFVYSGKILFKLSPDLLPDDSNYYLIIIFFY